MIVISDVKKWKDDSEKGRSCYVSFKSGITSWFYLFKYSGRLRYRIDERNNNRSYHALNTFRSSPTESHFSECSSSSLLFQKLRLKTQIWLIFTFNFQPDVAAVVHEKRGPGLLRKTFDTRQRQVIEKVWLDQHKE